MQAGGSYILNQHSVLQESFLTKLALSFGFYVKYKNSLLSRYLSLYTIKFFHSTPTHNIIIFKRAPWPRQDKCVQMMGEKFVKILCLSWLSESHGFSSRSYSQLVWVSPLIKNRLIISQSQAHIISFLETHHDKVVLVSLSVYAIITFTNYTWPQYLVYSLGNLLLYSDYKPSIIWICFLIHGIFQTQGRSECTGVRSHIILWYMLLCYIHWPISSRVSVRAI